jgi:hypothetical protein
MAASPAVSRATDAIRPAAASSPEYRASSPRVHAARNRLGALAALALGAAGLRLRRAWRSACSSSRRTGSAGGPRVRLRVRASASNLGQMRHAPDRELPAKAAFACVSSGLRYRRYASSMASWLSGSTSSCWSCCEVMSHSSTYRRPPDRRPSRVRSAEVNAPAACPRDGAPHDEAIGQVAPVGQQGLCHLRILGQVDNRPRPSPRRHRCESSPELARPPRKSPSASTKMLLPAPVSPVMTVSPGPRGSSTSSMSAKPVTRRCVSMSSFSAMSRPKLRGEGSCLALAPRKLLPQDLEKGMTRPKHAQIAL